MKKIHLILSALVMVILSSCYRDTFQVTDLRCEGLDSPVGIDNTRPHFSWKIKSDGPFMQAAYEIEVASSPDILKKGEADIWKSGRINSGESVMVEYEGSPLHARQVCYWRVRAAGQDGEFSKWSSTGAFSIGILDSKMEGDFITYGGGNKAVLFRKSFDFKKGERAFLYVCSLGYHYAFVNGCPVGSAIMNPAVSQLNERALINTYDISPYLRDGRNELVIWAGQGWYKKDTFGAERDAAAVKVELDLGTEVLFASDESWLAAESGYTDLGTWLPHGFTGEKMDAGLFPTSFRTKGLDRIDWSEAETVDAGDIELTQQMCQSNEVVETVHPVSIEPYGDSLWLADMGKVINGLFGMRVKGMPEGSVVKARYCDFINFEGKLDMPQNEEDIYICSGRKTGDFFINRFSPHPFRYVLISGLDRKPSVKDVFGKMVSIGFDDTSSFLCSDDDINRIHDMIKHTLACLCFNGYMVDCPHIEKGGYGGDGNSSTNTLQTMYDADALYYNWLQAWRDCQAPDGGLPHTAPEPYKAGGGPYWCSFIIAAPYRTFLHYGDPRLMEGCYEAMKKWLGYVDAYTVDGLLRPWPDTEYRNWYLGDWLAPEGTDYKDPVSVDLVSNCAVSRSLGALAEIADYLGDNEAAGEYRCRRNSLNALIHETFYNESEGTYASGSQIDMAYPLLAGAVPDNLREKVHEKLVEIIHTVSNDHIGTGLTGVPILTEWLTESGEQDLMYSILKQPDYPGYMFMINNGATTTWEEWGASRSRVHNCYNGIGTWFYEALGGIVSEAPGYRKVRIRPQMPEGMQWAEVSQETPYGTIKSAWKKDAEGHVHVRVEIPPCVEADIWNGTEYETTGNGVFEREYQKGK